MSKKIKKFDFKSIKLAFVIFKNLSNSIQNIFIFNQSKLLQQFQTF